MFKIKHKDDSSKDVEVSIEIEEDEQTVYWTGLPRAAEIYMQDFDFGTQSKHPFVCLKMMLNQQREQVEGLRPHDEISRNVAEAIQIKKANPALHYKIIKTVARGGFGEIFQVQRLSDKKIFALKYVLGVTAAERQLVINESSLIAFLDSNEIIKCVDLYDYNKRIWIFLEYMEDGALTNIILKQNKIYSEEFCRYTLYKTAMGLLKMHSKNVLHRDIKSDNILCDRNGEIKIADLGFSVFLSEQQAYRKTKRGTPNWVSPEIAQGVQYSKEVDVWAYGCFAYELATGSPPFANIKKRSDLLDSIVNKPVPRIPDRWSDTF